MSKFFLVNPNINSLPKEDIAAIAQSKIKFNSQVWQAREKNADEAIKKACTLKHVYGRVVIKVNEESKNYHTFSDGTVIRRERKFNNFNFREVNPSNAIVVSAENIPANSEILIDYTAIHDSYKIFDYDSGSSDVQYYSIKEDDCYAWKNGDNDWLPLRNYEFGLRVFKPYTGLITGIEPTLLKDVLYVSTGNLRGLAVRTLKGCDYQIVFQNEDGREANLIRFRHSDSEKFDREEVVGIAHDLTELVYDGKLLVGLSTKDAKPLNKLT